MIKRREKKTKTGLLLYSNLSPGGDKEPLVSQEDTLEADERAFKPLHTQQVHFKPVCGREYWEVCQHLRSGSCALHKSIPSCRSNPFTPFRADQELQLPRLFNANAGQEVQPTFPCTYSGVELETLNYRLSDLQWNAAWLFIGSKHELNDIQII